MTKLRFSLAAIALLGATACDRAISNMQTLVSDDCGKNWRLINVGQTVPARVGPCALKVTVPNYPMQGDAQFRAAFGNRVLTNVSVGYEYRITDSVLFISEARYIGRQNSAGDGSENSAGVYESAENAIIDRRIREVASEMLVEQDIVTFDQALFEIELLAAINDVLKDRGVTIDSIAFVPMPDEQTRMAIDVAAALRVYESVGLEEAAEGLLTARAGATRVTVNTSSQSAE